MQASTLASFIQQQLAVHFAEVYLVQCVVKEGRQKGIDLTVDTDAGIALGVCAKVNRMLRAALEAEDASLAAYELRVSSPGVGEPLRIPRQYRQNVGRQLAVTTTTGDRIEGLLKAFDEAQASLTLALKAKKRPTAQEPIHKTLPLSEVKQAVVQVSFR